MYSNWISIGGIELCSIVFKYLHIDIPHIIVVPQLWLAAYLTICIKYLKAKVTTIQEPWRGTCASVGMRKCVDGVNDFAIYNRT